MAILTMAVLTMAILTMAILTMATLAIAILTMAMPSSTSLTPTMLPTYHSHHQVRCFLDLSSTGSQLRFLQNSLRPARAALGFIELAELQSVQLLQGSPSYCRTIPALAGATHVLELSGASHTWLLSASDVVGLRRWASQLRRAHQQARKMLSACA